VSIEDAHRYNNLELFENFKKTKIIIGFLKIASSVEENCEEIIKRIKDISNHIDLKNIIAAPDCGLGHLPRELAKKKLKIMVDATKNF
jgi:Methionine synthase II (cobalamin-independent)